MYRNPYVFIVGCPRSGTTLLQRIVDAHPEIAITPSVHWIRGYFRERKIRKQDPVTPELLSGLLENRRFARFRIPREALEKLVESGESVTYSKLLASIFDLYGKVEGKRLVGNKSATYVRRLPELHALWPEAKFVHIIRDGRDVCLSVINWRSAGSVAGHYATWVEDPVSTAALWWRRKVLLGQEGGKPLGPDLYYEVRYESLVAHPAEECAALCAFLGVPYDDAMLRFDERREGLDPDFERRHPLMAITPGLRDWRSQLSAEDIERFEAAAGDLLDELGYARAVRHPSPRALEHASRIRNSFTRDVRARGRGLLPERW